MKNIAFILVQKFSIVEISYIAQIVATKYKLNASQIYIVRLLEEIHKIALPKQTALLYNPQSYPIQIEEIDKLKIKLSSQKTKLTVFSQLLDV